jgi:hypothetical protein
MKPLRLPQSLRLPLPLTLLTLILAAAGSTSAATLTVTSLADSGPGTLRDRIAAANPGDTITFGIQGDIVLASQLTIAKNLNVFGFGVEGLVRISGNNSTRVFNITAGNVFLNRLAIINGRVTGTNGAAGQNGQTVRGGGILIGDSATVIMLECVLSNNVVIGGAAGTGGTGGNGFGGGVGNLGTVNFDTCLVVSNSCLGGSGGAFDGAGQAWGGGLHTEGTATVQGTTFYANTASGGNGGGGNGTGAGGGIYNVGTTLIRASSLLSNAAASAGIDFGGAIDDFGTLTIQDSTIYGNQADYGGGITGGNIGNTILAGNTAGVGPDGTGFIVSSDYNLIQNPSTITFSGVTSHNITGVNPLLGPPATTVGATPLIIIPVLVPQAGSPVIDKGKNINSADQRGLARPYDGTIANAAGGNGADIGAIELYPGTITVVNTNNSGPGSLRQALADNSSLGGNNVITFSNSVTGTITLSGAHLTLNAPAIIRGPGPETLAVSANQIGRVFLVTAGPSEISGLTIRDGLITGSPGQGGQPNGSDGQGGGIFNQATLTISNCVVLSNTVVGGVGAVRQNAVVGNGGRGIGGGVYNASGILRAINSSFIGNKSIGGRGGFAQQNAAGQGGNGWGGAVGTFGGSNYFAACKLVNNLAEGGLGGASGGGGTPAYGGQGYGGGIYSESSITINSSTLHGGRAVGGNAGDGTANGAGSGYGGGIYNVADLRLHSTTLASNSVSGSTFDFGGAAYSVGSAGITNCTVAGNQADFGGGWHGDAIVANSIFALNTAGSGADFSGTMNSLDYNLVQSSAGLNISGATANVLIGVNPLLGPLQANGGPTFTMALLPGSPAVDKGRSFGALTDQRGSVRPYNLPSIANASGGDGCDIGAYEFIPTPQLHIHQTLPAHVVLSWSTDAGDFYLDSATNLPPPGGWLEVTNQRVFVGDQTYVTNAAPDPARFYRLRFPSGGAGSLP